jgi:hypothetical protein
MMFYPHRKTAAYLGIACLVAGVATAYTAHERASSVLWLGSILAIFGAIIFLGPVIRNQTIAVGDASLLVRTFGRAVELKASHLTEVVRNRAGGMSYRFKSGTLLFQVTPLAYHHANILQQKFDRLFDLDRLGITITGPRRPNQTVQRTGASRSAQETNRTSEAAGSRR